MQKKSLFLPLAAAALVVSGGLTAVTVAQAADTTPTTTTTTTADQRQHGTPPAAMGTVTAVSGDTITLTDKKNNTTYTVDASAATITKHEKPTTQGAQPTTTTISVSDIAVGDELMVQGTANGTTVTATKIEDGMMFGGMGGGRGPGAGTMGTVTAVNGSTLTVQDKDGKTYTVDATSATFSKMQTISVSDIQVGDSVGVEGDTSGTTVTAKHIMDGLPNAKTGS